MASGGLEMYARCWMQPDGVVDGWADWGEHRLRLRGTGTRQAASKQHSCQNATCWVTNTAAWRDAAAANAGGMATAWSCRRVSGGVVARGRFGERVRRGASVVKERTPAALKEEAAARRKGWQQRAGGLREAKGPGHFAEQGIDGG